MSKVRVGVVGVGNCASSLVQGVGYYAKARSDERVPGLMHVNLGHLHVSDIDFSCAFDVDAAKVGLDLSDAIWAEPNNTTRFHEPQPWGVQVKRGPTLDGLGEYYQDVIRESEAPVADVVA